VIVHRRDAENAKGRWIFLSVDPLESEADMKRQKGKNLMPSGKSKVGLFTLLNSLRPPCTTHMSYRVIRMISSMLDLRKTSS
jgi:hypothetical protein